MPRKPTGHRSQSEVESWLNHKGFALEHEVARAFRRVGFETSLGRTYLDPNEGKPREIDVVAEALLTNTPAHMFAIVECKAHAIGAWVVREAELGWNEDLWIPISTPGLVQDLARCRHIPAKAMPVAELGAPAPFAIIEAVDSGDRDAAYWALSQAVSAARGWMSRMTEPSIAIPMVVVDTPLFTVRFGQNGEQLVTEITTKRVLWADPPGPSTIVQVITRGALAEVATDLRHEFGYLADDLIKAGIKPNPAFAKG